MPRLRILPLLIALCSLLSPFGLAKTSPQAAGWCGTYPERAQEELELHRRSFALARTSTSHWRGGATSGRAANAANPAPRRYADIGNIAVIDDSGGVVARRNPFTLAGRGLTFTPVIGVAGLAGYRYATSASFYDAGLLTQASTLNLSDDDTLQQSLPFSFPYFGERYDRLWVNSDGNVTFGEGDNASADRSLGRFNSGLPRIAAMYVDLDPSISGARVSILRNASQVTITWSNIPEFGLALRHNVQLTLFSDGRIAIAFASASPTAAVVGISPGTRAQPLSLVRLSTDDPNVYPGAIGERFGNAEELDVVTATQRFYETHPDVYDYVAFINNFDLSAGFGTLAFQTTVRARRLGIGEDLQDLGREYGSPRKLQAVLNLGPLSNYPANPNAPMPLRFSTGDTGLTILGHEAGHLFLAFASVRGANDPTTRPMLGRQSFHWNFRFNSEASLLEGNRIRDNGEGANPRFLTTATVEGFAPLDQYLMGLRAPEEVPPTFLVENSSLPASTVDPRVNVPFNGTRRDITVQDLIAAEGRRTPDHTVEQRRYRIAFVLVVPAGTEPRQSDLDKLNSYLREFESGWSRWTGNRGAMDASLGRLLSLSVEPNSFALPGQPLPITLRVSPAPATPLRIALRDSRALFAGLPTTVEIPAGQTEARVTLTAPQPGIALLEAQPADSSYLTAEARVAVHPLSSPASLGQTLSLQLEAGDGQVATLGTRLPQPLVFSFRDGNGLAMPGASPAVTVLGGGSVQVPNAPAGAAPQWGPDGRLSLLWTTGPAGTNTLAGQAVSVAIPGTSLSVTARLALVPATVANAIVNAASFAPGLSPGAIATIFGENLQPAEVLLNGNAARIFFQSPGQINFLVPANVAGSAITVLVRNNAGSTQFNVPLRPLQPGLFFNTSNRQAASIYRGHVDGRAVFELYGTGFGTSSARDITAFADGQPVQVLFSGAAPGFAGLQQINVQLPAAANGRTVALQLNVSGNPANDTLLLVPNP